MSDLITAKEAAKIIGVTRRQVLYLLRDGVLPGRRVGNQWVIERADVMAYKSKRESSGEKRPK